jgi:Uma2 family endonuclease
MGMPAQHIEWNAEMARALPEDGMRHEVLDGELVVSPAPAPDHQRIILALAVLLDDYVRRHRLGRVMISPADIEFSSRRLVQPDLFIVPEPEASTVRSWSEITRLMLVIEVLSPSTARADRLDKRIIYQDERIPEYWIVDPHARVVERWAPDDERPAIEARTLEWRPEAGIPPFTVALPQFFRDAIGDA